MVIKPFNSNDNVRKFQQGGEMTPAAPAQSGADQQLQQLAGQLLDMLMQQLQDPNAVMAVLQTAMDMLAQATQSQMSQEAAPAEFMRCGGKVTMKKCGGKAKKTKKASCGLKTRKKC